MSMAIGGINSINSMLDQSAHAETTQKTDSLKNTINGLSSTSTEEELKEMSMEEIADLKVETENMIQRLDDIIDMCNKILN